MTNDYIERSYSEFTQPLAVMHAFRKCFHALQWDDMIYSFAVVAQGNKQTHNPPGAWVTMRIPQRMPASSLRKRKRVGQFHMSHANEVLMASSQVLLASHSITNMGWKPFYVSSMITYNEVYPLQTNGQYSLCFRLEHPWCQAMWGVAYLSAWQAQEQQEALQLGGLSGT